MRHLLIILTLKSAKRAISLGGQLQIPHAVCRALFSPCLESFSSKSKSRRHDFEVTYRVARLLAFVRSLGNIFGAGKGASEDESRV